MTAIGSKKHDATGRSTGKIKLRSGVGQIPEQFAPRTIRMIESPAFQALSLAARKILDRLEIELAHHAGKDNGSLPCPFEHFVEFGLHRHAIAPALRELEALGFIVITRGRAGNGEHRTPSRYRLTYRHTTYENPTDDWQKIETDEEAKAIAKAARKGQNKNNSPVPVSVTGTSAGFRH